MRALTLALVLVAAGAAWAQPEPEEVTHLPAERVRTAFARGEPLVENAAFKVHASRREQPGLAEVHTRDTDVVYVLEGTATLVTGGSVVEPREVAPQEIRGASIAGGTARALAPGDVVIVPAGVPHWFRQVQGPLLYYVVKVTGEGDAS